MSGLQPTQPYDGRGSEGGEEGRTPPPAPIPRGAHPSSMTERLGWLHRLLSRWAFRFVHVDPKAVERVRELSKRGSVVYVMRDRSVADYMLLNAVCLRHKLPLPQFANGVAIGWFRTLRWILRRIAKRVAARQFFGHTERQLGPDRDMADALVAHGQPILLFLRARATGFGGLLRLREAMESSRIGEPYLEDLFRRAGDREIAVVPLALFRGRGYKRRSSRLATLVYSVQEAPNEAKKLLTFLFNRQDVALTIGEEIPLRSFVERYGREGESRMARRLVRALQLFLYREERVVWGPRLRPKARVRELVIGAPEMQATIDRLANERRARFRDVQREAEGYFDELASNFNGTYFAIVAFVFRRIWNRMFLGVELSGLDRVADRIREHAVVLVPCHRSHFDYLILSYIFHGQFLSPPHIAAGINLSFFPMGMLFRGAGAYFIRRTFEGNDLYKAVFRQYLTYLIAEGYTQEFFIEGGRSRTGKILTPKLGMLSAIVGAFLHGVRRDLYFVPVSVSYERLVEEEAYKRELLGAEKEKENLLALLRARSVLSANYGKAHVDFAEPMSLNEALGPLKERFRDGEGDPAVEEEKRRFILKLGFRLLGEVNAVSVLSPQSVASTVLLSNAYPAMRSADFLRAAHWLCEHARSEGAPFTAALEAERDSFHDTLGFLEKSGVLVRIPDGDGAILHVPDDKRLNLDFYKNNSIHLFVILSLVAHSLLRGVPQGGVRDDLWWWLDLFRNEFVLPEREGLAERLESLRVRFEEAGAVVENRVNADHPWLRASASILQNFREAYWIATRVLRDLPADGIAENALVQEMQRLYRANLLLGVLRKPEGNTTVTLQNAIGRLQEMGYVAPENRGRAHWVVRGPAYEELGRVERRLLESVTSPAGRG